MPKQIPIFVYGTLLRGCRNYRRCLSRFSKKVAEAKAKGTLYHLKGKCYPAMILEGDTPVFGEVHWIDENEYDQAIDQLDAIENYEEDRELINEYNRETILVCYDGISEEMQAYIYNMKSIYNREDERILIPDGNWKNYLEKESIHCSKEKK